MKNRKATESGNWDRIEMEGPKPTTMKKKKNMNRLGGRGTGLSLQAFANAKSTTNHYNPALIKKQRDFYKNAQYVNKYKKSLKQQNQGNDLLSARRIPEDDNGDIDNRRMNKKKKKNSSHSLIELYEKQREEKEKARMEREAIIQARKEQKEKSDAQRKEGRKKMFKKTRHGQPVMKYRIQHLLQSIQSSSSASGNKNV